MDIQKLIDTMNDLDQHTRANYHLTLGKLIESLAPMSGTLPVHFDWNGYSPNKERSYRGYYCDLAFDWGTEPMTVETLAGICGRALGSTYMGYKGGDYVMGDRTPLWAAEYGHEGRAIVGISLADDRVIIITKDLEE